MAEQRDVPQSGLTGWGAARKILLRVQDEERRVLLTSLVRHAGVQGAPALEYVARLLRWHVDEADAPTPPMKLADMERRYCERRAQEAIAPYVAAGDRRLAKVHRGLAA
jgi:hypothetical protein